MATNNSIKQRDGSYILEESQHREQSTPRIKEKCDAVAPNITNTPKGDHHHHEPQNYSMYYKLKTPPKPSLTSTKKQKPLPTCTPEMPNLKSNRARRTLDFKQQHDVGR